jgi:hypothetical protein
MSKVVRDEFVNDAGSTIGVVTVDHRGEPNAKPVLSGETVWLSREEQILTANAPRNEADNVLVNGKLRKITSGVDIESRRPLAPAEAPAPAAPVEIAEVGTVVAEQPPAENGQLQPTEEVATPAAQAKPKPKPTKSS